MSKMSVRRVRGSFRGSLRRYGSAESSRKPVRHHNWVYRNGEWRIAFGKNHLIIQSNISPLIIKLFVCTCLLLQCPFAAMTLIFSCSVCKFSCQHRKCWETLKNRDWFIFSLLIYYYYISFYSFAYNSLYTFKYKQIFRKSKLI